MPPVATRASAPAQPAHKVPTFKEELETCIRSETDPQVQESLVLLYSDLFDSPRTSDSQPVAGPSKPPGTRVRVSVEGSAPATFTLPTEVKLARRPTFESRPTSEGTPSRRTLEEIKEVGIVGRACRDDVAQERLVKICVVEDIREQVITRLSRCWWDRFGVSCRHAESSTFPAPGPRPSE